MIPFESALILFCVIFILLMVWLQHLKVEAQLKTIKAKLKMVKMTLNSNYGAIGKSIPFHPSI